LVMAALTLNVVGLTYTRVKDSVVLTFDPFRVP